MAIKVGDWVQTQQLKTQGAAAKVESTYVVGGVKQLVLRHYTPEGQITGSSSVVPVSASTLQKIPVPTPVAPAETVAERVQFEGRDVTRFETPSGKILHVEPKKELSPREAVTPSTPLKEPPSVALKEFEVRLPSGRVVKGAEGSTFTDQGEKFRVTSVGGLSKVELKGVDVSVLATLPIKSGKEEFLGYTKEALPSFLKGGVKIAERGTGARKVSTWVVKEGTQVVEVDAYGRSISTRSAEGLTDVEGKPLPKVGEEKLIVTPQPIGAPPKTYAQAVQEVLTRKAVSEPTAPISVILPKADVVERLTGKVPKSYAQAVKQTFEKETKASVKRARVVSEKPLLFVPTDVAKTADIALKQTRLVPQIMVEREDLRPKITGVTGESYLKSREEIRRFNEALAESEKAEFFGVKIDAVKTQREVTTALKAAVPRVPAPAVEFVGGVLAAPTALAVSGVKRPVETAAMAAAAIGTVVAIGTLPPAGAGIATAGLGVLGTREAIIATQERGVAGLGRFVGEAGILTVAGIGGAKVLKVGYTKAGAPKIKFEKVPEAQVKAVVFERKLKAVPLISKVKIERPVFELELIQKAKADVPVFKLARKPVERIVAEEKIVFGAPKEVVFKQLPKELPTVLTGRLYDEFGARRFGATPEKVEIATTLQKAARTTVQDRPVPVERLQDIEFKTLSKPESTAVLDFIAKQGETQELFIYGSPVQKAFMGEAMIRQPKDLDIQLIGVTEEEAIAFANKALKILQKEGGKTKFRIDPSRPLLVEKKIPVKGWVHALDIHAEALPTEGISAIPRGEFGRGFVSQPLTEIAGIKTITLGEQAGRKVVSVTLPQRRIGIGPEPHRLKDIPDAFATQEFLLRQRGAKQLLKEVTKLRSVAAKEYGIPRAEFGQEVYYYSKGRLYKESPLLPVLVSPSAKPVSLDVSPVISPAVSPVVSPVLTPSISLRISPAISPQISPVVSKAAVSLPVSPTLPSVSPRISIAVSPPVLPSVSPAVAPSISPKLLPSVSPNLFPSISPTIIPSVSPVLAPSISPKLLPSVSPKLAPSVSPKLTPSISPKLVPSVSPRLTSSLTLALATPRPPPFRYPGVPKQPKIIPFELKKVLFPIRYRVTQRAPIADWMSKLITELRTRRPGTSPALKVAVREFYKSYGVRVPTAEMLALRPSTKRIKRAGKVKTKSIKRRKR